MTKLKFLLAIIFLAVVSYYSNDMVRRLFVDFTSTLTTGYYDGIRGVSDFITKHLDQADEIEELRAQNTELERSAALLSSFAYELNSILDDKQSALYAPQVRLVRATSYAQLGDNTKIWLDFDEFDENKIYGLMHKGATAGIVINKGGRPLALLQTDPSAMFSVYIGDERIAGVASGTGKEIIIRYITKWHNPKVGDEVFTSGLDGIFFGGVLVGTITDIKEQELYKSAIVAPAITPSIPTTLYIITKEK